MNLRNALSAALAIGILYAVFPKNNFAFGERTNNKKARYHKLSKPDRNIAYSQNITHILIGARIITQFSPKDLHGEKIELSKLASNLNYDHFNWVSYVEQDPHGILDRAGKKMFTPYNDPPVGGYQYDRADKFPFYWDVVDCNRCNQRHHIQNHNNSQQYSLVFEDAPADYRLQPGEAVEFITNLVGVKNIDVKQNKAEWDILHTFRWKLTNPRTNYSQVSLVDTNVDLSHISPSLLNVMLWDGATSLASMELSDFN